jgi:hypothetical protein
VGKHPVDAAVDPDELFRTRWKPLVEVDDVFASWAFAGYDKHRLRLQLLKGMEAGWSSMKALLTGVPMVEVGAFQIAVEHQAAFDISAVLAGVDQVFPGQV